VHCKVFEDNEGAIEIAKVPKMRPRTKHLNIKYHHFREEVRKGPSASFTPELRIRLLIYSPSPYLKHLL
jgi:hypothetical protein